jgi:hypothetical protein
MCSKCNRDDFHKRGWRERDGTVRDLHLLNGRLFPFIQTSDGSIDDYTGLQRFILMLNENYRSKLFNVFGSGAMAAT